MRVLGMFARRPEPGKTKTRLAATLGNELAAELYAAFVSDLLTRVPPLGDCFLLGVTPADEGTQAWFRQRTPASSLILSQPEVDLGGRIDWFFRRAAEQGGQPCVLIGSDSPDLPDTHITAAFEALQTADLVLAPAADGGYVLIGLNRPIPELFEDLPWSTAATLTATIQRATHLGLRTRLIDPWYDVDTIHNLGTLLPRLTCSAGQGNATETPVAGDAPQTRQTLLRYADIITEHLQHH